MSETPAAPLQPLSTGVGVAPGPGTAFCHGGCSGGWFWGASPPQPSQPGLLFLCRSFVVEPAAHQSPPQPLLLPLQPLGCWRQPPLRGAGACHFPRHGTVGPRGSHGLSSPFPRRGAPCPLPAGPSSAKSSRRPSSTSVRERSGRSPPPHPGAGPLLCP